ncbi:hypothetical protein [Pectobacterium brasiliense]|nr:hypothetical protein [Pectobacterium brasiliense]MDY4381844.1 hypothetical protein [Pectobacterium brasiliense]
MGRVFASQAVRIAGMNTEGTAKRRESRRKARGQGAAAIERALSGV